MWMERSIYSIHSITVAANSIAHPNYRVAYRNPQRMILHIGMVSCKVEDRVSRGNNRL